MQQLVADAEKLQRETEIVAAEAQLLSEVLADTVKLCQYRPTAVRRAVLDVVPKVVEQGPRGGFKYKNQYGHYVYLKKGQVSRCLQGELAGAVSGCPPQ